MPTTSRSPLRRRQFIGGLASALASSCGDSDTGAGAGGAGGGPGSACVANLPCNDAAVGAMTSEIMRTNRDDIIQRAAGFLRDGASMEDLYYAAFSAGIRASSFRTHSNHTCKMVESARQLSLGTTGHIRYVPLMWALDMVCPCPFGIQDPRDAGTPIGPMDDSALPTGNAAATALELAMLDYDRDGAQRAIVGLHRSGDVDAVRAGLHRWASRNALPNGHWAIQVAQYLRIMDANEWRCAEPVLRHMVYTLATPYADTENPQAWEDGEQGFLANRQRVASVPATWPTGAVDDVAAADLAVQFRDLDREGAAQVVVDSLTSGLAPQSIWDAILLNRAEIILSSVGSGYDEHCVTSVTALHDLYQAATQPDTKLLLMLQASGFYVGDWTSKRTDVLAALSPLAAPASATQILDSLDADHANGSSSADGRLTAAAQTLGWFAQGRSAEEFDRAAMTVIARKAGGDWHHYKVTVALLENARAVSPVFAPRIRAALMLFMQAPTDQDWARHDEVMSAVSDLPG